MAASIESWQWIQKITASLISVGFQELVKGYLILNQFKVNELVSLAVLVALHCCRWHTSL